MTHLRGTLFNHPGTTLGVSGNADWTVNQINIANHETDSFTVGRRAFFDARPYVDSQFGIEGQTAPGLVFVGEPGDVKFGWVRSDTPTFLTIHEDDSTFLTRIGGGTSGINDTKLISIDSKGDIGFYSRALIQTSSTANLSAAGKITASSAAQSIKGERFSLVASSISIGLDATTVTFNSTGDVTLAAKGDLVLRGSNTGHVVRLVAPDTVSSIEGTTLDARWLQVNARSIWLANRDASERFTILGRANLFATESAIVGRVGAFDAIRLNFSSRFFEGNFGNPVQLIGQNVADSAIIRSSGNILDLAETRIEIANQIRLQAPAVYLGDSEDNEIEVCGHINFDVTDFASLHRNGNVTVGSWNVLGDSAGSWINPDSRSCS